MAYSPSAKRILVVNGPNLNLLGRRRPDVYGTETMEQVLDEMRHALPGTEIEYYQSNHEGRLIDCLQRAWLDDVPRCGIVLNAGAYTHTSLALHDAIEAIEMPVVEIHISDIYSREPIRHRSMIKDVCVASVVGHGTAGYTKAAKILLDK